MFSFIERLGNRVAPGPGSGKFVHESLSRRDSSFMVLCCTPTEHQQQRPPAAAKNSRTPSSWPGVIIYPQDAWPRVRARRWRVVCVRRVWVCWCAARVPLTQFQLFSPGCYPFAVAPFMSRNWVTECSLGFCLPPPHHGDAPPPPPHVAARGPPLGNSNALPRRAPTGAPACRRRHR